MLKFNKDLAIEHLPVDVHEDLVAELNKDDTWKILAEYVAEKLDYTSLWIKTLEGKKGVKNETSADKLLIELSIKLCTVEVLCTLLENCNLLKVLSILHTPETLKIVTHPDYNVKDDILYVALGQKLQLTCKAYGLPPPDYQWYHEDVSLEGETLDTLDIIITSVTQKGAYKCQVYQQSHKGERLYQTYSKPVFVDIEATPVSIEQQPQPFSEVKEGECLELYCEATSYPSPQFQWYRNNNMLDNQTCALLKIEKFTAKDEGKYYCHIYNSISEKFTQPSTVFLELPRQKAVAKIALLIANENYETQVKLRTPKNDVAKIAKILSALGFHTICLADLTLVQMQNAIEIFCNSLVEGTYGFFYFAGHGFKMQESYMLSIDAPIDFLRKDAICESQVLSLALKSDPTLLVVVLDMCQTFPAKDCNPKIHKELPSINEYKGQKNLRNLLQAYSTSSYRPSYERMGKDYGLYAKHLSKYLDENIPVTKVFEQVGKSIDTWLKGAERKQIPMFATTITKPFRLTDTILQDKLPEKIENLERITTFSNKIVGLSFQQTQIKCKAMISQYTKPYLNFIQVSLFELDEKLEINFYNSIHANRNNLFQCSSKNKCYLNSSQIHEGPIVISLMQNGAHVGATLLDISHLVPALLNKLNL